MKADQINRFMRVNGRKNLWLLRNTNQLYENAVKSYYCRSTSLLPYNPAIQNAKVREENRAPVRELSMRQKRISTSDYPRNHVQMAELAASANSGQLLDTVIKANRRRSMSFTAGGLRMYGKQMLNGSFGRGRGSSSDDSNSMIGGSRLKGRQPLVQPDGDHFDLSVLSGRSMSSPPRTTLELGIGYGFGKDKGPPSCKHHLSAIEKTANASAASLARRQRTNYECDDDQLMVVDEALKQRLAMRFNRHSEDEPGAARFRLGFGSDSFIDGRQLPKVPKSYKMRGEQATPHRISKEQTRFQTLGERIKQFKVIQFADGPVTFNAFNRRQGAAGARIQQYGNRHLPKQEPCLSFHNVLHTNHRQRSINSQTRSQSLETNVKPVSKAKEAQDAMRVVISQHNVTSQKPPKPPKPLKPLKPLGPLGPQAHKLDALARLAPAASLSLSSQLLGLKPQPSRPPEKCGKSKSRRSDKEDSSRNLKLASSKTKTNVKEKEKEKKNGLDAQSEETEAKAKAEVPGGGGDTTVHPKLQSKASQDSFYRDQMQTTASNTLSRTNHLLYMKDNARRQDLVAPKPAEQPQAVNKVKVRREHDVLPKQPQLIKGAHHLLAASASQVSAYKRAFKNRQQILQAEMLHIHAQRLPEQQQQRQRLQQLHQTHQQEQQHQQQQRLVQRQQLSKASSYLPPVTKKHVTSQPMDESKPLAKQLGRMQTTKTKTTTRTTATTTTTTPPVQQQHQQQYQQQHQQQLQQQQQQQQQQSSVKQVAANGKTRQQPEGKPGRPTPSPPNPPRANNQKLAGIEVAVEATAHLSRKPVPRLAYTFKPAGHEPVTEQTKSASYQRQQQQQLHQQLRQRRQQPNESPWRHT